MTLDQLRVDQEGIITRVGGQDSLRLRLLDMGLIPKTAVRVHKLEDRVDVLEAQQYDDRTYIADLKAYIYRAGLNPPERNPNP